LEGFDANSIIFHGSHFFSVCDGVCDRENRPCHPQKKASPYLLAVVLLVLPALLRLTRKTGVEMAVLEMAMLEMAVVVANSFFPKQTNRNLSKGANYVAALFGGNGRDAISKRL
jgi:hypothetical protein